MEDLIPKDEPSSFNTFDSIQIQSLKIKISPNIAIRIKPSKFINGTITDKPKFEDC